MTTNPNEDLEIREVSAKNSKLEAIEFMREMAGFPQMDYSKIAERMRIPQSTARDYLKRYIWGVLHTMHDSDYPRRLLEIYNHDTVAVPPAKALTRQDINHLNPVVNRYAKYTVEHPEVQKSSDGGGRPVMDKPRPRTLSRKSREQEDDEAEEDEDESEEDEEERFTPQKLMAPIAGSTNAQYINAILRDIPGIPSYKIERYLQFFTKNEADYMANPDRFKKELKVWFGDGPGEMIFSSFHYGMSTFGRTGQGIGVNPYTGQPYSSSGQGSGTNDWIRNNPNLETYYKMGIIPYGVPPDSGIAIEAVNNFHEKQRRKEQREEEDESFNRWLKAHTARAMEENISGGQNRGGMDMNMTQLLAAGIVEMQLGVDESGRQVVKYIPKRNNSGGGGLFGGGNGNGNDPNMSLLSTIISGKDALINTLISKSMETPKVMESLLGKFIQNMDPDPTVQLTRLKQVSESLFPNNNVQNNIEAVRLKLEQTRLEKDMTMADNEARRLFEKDRWEKERSERMEIEAGKNTQNIMNGILGLGKEMLGPAMALLSGKGLAGLMPGGMPGGMPGMGMPPNPFAGFQQQQQNPFAQQQRPQPQPQQRTLSPEAYAYMKQVEEAKRAGPSPGFAAARPGQSFRPFQEAPPRRPVMQGQDVIEEYEEVPHQHVHQHVHQSVQPQGPRVYSPAEFENASPETLQNAEKEILRRKAELDNYLNSLRVAKRKRSNVFRTKRPTPEVDSGPQQFEVPVVGGGSTQIDTTVGPSTSVHQDIAVTSPRSETGSVDIPDMIPEKIQREEVVVPGQVVEETEEEEEEEYEEGDEDEEGEEEIEEAVEEEEHK